MIFLGIRNHKRIIGLNVSGISDPNLELNQSNFPSSKIILNFSRWNHAFRIAVH